MLLFHDSYVVSTLLHILRVPFCKPSNWSCWQGLNRSLPERSLHYEKLSGRKSEKQSKYTIGIVLVFFASEIIYFKFCGYWKWAQDYILKIHCLNVKRLASEISPISERFQFGAKENHLIIPIKWTENYVMRLAHVYICGSRIVFQREKGLQSTSIFSNILSGLITRKLHFDQGREGGSMGRICPDIKTRTWERFASSPSGMDDSWSHTRQ